MKKPASVNRILWYEGIGFLLIIAFFWIHALIEMWGAAARAAPAAAVTAAAALAPAIDARLSTGWIKTLVLTSLVVAIAAPVMLLTRRLVNRLNFLEEIFIVCSWCKKMERDRQWVPLDEFFHDKFHAITSHGICATCLEELRNEQTVSRN